MAKKIISIDLRPNGYKRKDFSNNKYLDTAYWIFTHQPSQDSGFSIRILNKIILSISIGHSFALGFLLTTSDLQLHLGPIYLEIY